MSRFSKQGLSAALAIAAFFAAAPESTAATYLRVASWNTRHAGWSGEQDWAGYAAQIWNQFGSASNSANGCDVVCLQEVMYDTSVTSLVSALNSVSGFTWASTYTAPIGRTSYKERYAILYRTDRVSLLSSYTWNDVGDKFEREPQIATFRVTSTNADVTFINWHTVFGTTAQREQEIADIVDVYASVQSASGTDQDVILLGDHNAAATSAWWNDLKSTAHVSPAVTVRVDEATSINSSCAYVSKYDHFWLQASYVTEYSSSGKDYIANLCSFYSGISDHAPIWIKLYSSSDDD